MLACGVSPHCMPCGGNLGGRDDISVMRSVRVLRLLLLCGLIAGCATAPVQEMSDARQAIEAAREGGAEQHARRALANANALLENAQRQLALKHYAAAREQAMRAKQRAIDALDKARRAEAIKP